MDKIVEVFQKKLRKNIKNKIKKIILFGSRARGDSQINSDYDFAIIVKQRDKNLRRIVAELESDISIDFNFQISSLIFTEQEWEEKKVYPICQNIIKDGIIL